MKTEMDIQTLIERFLEGETSNAEEQTLYRYFESGEVDPALEKYREMFKWYAAGMPEDSSIPVNRGGGGLRARSPEHLRSARSQWVRWLSIAASLLLLVGVGLGLWHYQQQQEEYALYEGSYIIRNGQKITDIKQILPELKATELEVSEMMKQENINQIIPTI
jgi:hypothetical protein